MALPPLNPSLGRQVTSRNFSLLEMVERAWGSEWSAPDHGVYQFSGGRRFDSTDYGTTGIYQRGPTPFEVVAITDGTFDGVQYTVGDTFNIPQTPIPGTGG